MTYVVSLLAGLVICLAIVAMTVLSLPQLVAAIVASKLARRRGVTSSPPGSG